MPKANIFRMWMDKYEITNRELADVTGTDIRTWQYLSTKNNKTRRSILTVHCETIELVRYYVTLVYGIIANEHLSQVIEIELMNRPLHKKIGEKYEKSN